MDASHNLNPDAPSFASVSRTTSSTAMRNPTRHPPRKNIMPKIDYWTDQFKNICANYNDGNRILVIMRGAPGCGKSYLAKVIVESTVGTSDPKSYLHHIFTADDFMVVNGKYHYDINRLEEAHTKNQTHAFKALYEGRSPVIIDNTNICTWEMYPYVREGIKNGYLIEAIEPRNPWSRTPSQLAKRTVHGVPQDKIQKMLKKFEHSGLTGESLIKFFSVEYPVDMKPPVKRNKPPYEPLLPPVLHKEKKKPIPKIKTIEAIPQNVNNSLGTVNAENLQTFQQSKNETTKNVAEGETSNLDNQSQQKLSKKLDELQKVETEWDNGDSWEIPQSQNPDLLNSKPNVVKKLFVDPKPQRSKINEASNQFIEPSMLKDDWIDNLPSNTNSNCNKPSSKKGSENQEQTEIISNNNSNDDKDNTIIAVPEVIVEMPKTNHDLTQTCTNEDVNTSTVKGRCAHEEKHFKQLRKMFKNVPRAVLREIFDNCSGDVDWSCSIVLEYSDSIQHNNLQGVGDEQSDSEDGEEINSQCECDKPRDINIPDTFTKMLPAPDNILPDESLIKKKSKKDKILTGETIQIKKQIENTVKISEHHYSQHYLNMRKRYEDKSPNYTTSTSNNPGTSAPPASVLDEVPSSSATLMESQHNLNIRGRFENNSPNDMASTSNNPGTSVPSTSVLDAVPITLGTVMESQHYLNIRRRFEDKSPNDMSSTSNDPGTSAPPTSVLDAMPSTSATLKENYILNDEEYDDDYGDMSGSDEGMVENVHVNIGMDFVRQLDELYNRRDFEYPAGIKSEMSIPVRILDELNAFWIETISNQMDKLKTQSEKMIKEDEEFAR